ncbi:MAG: mandelate racemase/muconate lactonizing enzyme family protein, partial [Planctomycetota bacterium]
MKIARIKTHHLRDELDEPFGFSQWSYSARNSLLVQVIADDGTAGWGECYGPSEVHQAAITRVYGPRLIGLDPMAIDRLWHGMWQATLDFARGGIMMGAMSGIDMALWDLKGKALGLSVSELMGGRYRDSVPCYATGMYFKEMPEDAVLDALVDEAVGYAEQGFGAMKIKIGKNPDFDIRLIAAMRDALPGTALMADSKHAYDLPEAIRVG